MRRLSLLLVLSVGLASCGVDTAPSPTPPAPDTSVAVAEPPASTTTELIPPTTPTSTIPATTTTTEPLPPLQSLRLEIVATDLRRPVLVVSPNGDSRRFVVLQGGQVVILDEAGAPLIEPFLDITDLVNDNGIEQGLLGLAFHPDFASNGRFFVYHSVASNDTRLVEYTADPPSDVADPTTARTLLEVGQPTDRHNAGMLQFGPDGYLYVALGEGGAAAENAQNPDTLLGSILRIDVDRGEPYGIPADNPFVDGAAPEVWAIGLRNPWRFSIDGDTMYIGDVGHSNWEEINAVALDPVGYDFGWLEMEGTHCFRAGCNPGDFTQPVIEYSHADGCSVTGGFVYRGSSIPEIDGHYFYSDWCSGWIRSFRLVDGNAVEATDWTDQLGVPGQVTSFGVDDAGELYLTTWDGTVFQLVGERG